MIARRASMSSSWQVVSRILSILARARCSGAVKLSSASAAAAGQRSSSRRIRVAGASRSDAALATGPLAGQQGADLDDLVADGDDPGGVD
jgi:hypothetical protein